MGYRGRFDAKPFILPIYEQAEIFSENLAAVKLNCKWDL